MTSEKIRHHQSRKAFLYVRQSSAQQVLQDRVSRSLQYACPPRLSHRDCHAVTVRSSRSHLITDRAQTAFFTGDY